ncbi:MAG: hypothetical protein AOA65_0207 [Candidatus Bathyarchaeota archaeon BA1]|nr:MAG: hypothetical protein AOA65_0207 [Candidatus Bathyarchaeota archaeon BA1]
MRRYPILKEEALADFRHMGTQETFPIKTPEREELFANKWCALLYRKTPRDLFDIYQIASMELNPTIFRRCSVVDSLMRGKPKLHKINIDQVINKIPIDSSPRNLLQRETVSDFNFDDMRRGVIRFSKSIMAAFTKNEVRVIDQFFKAKRFEPELIDEEGVFHEKLREHPSIRWALTTPA